MYKILCKDGSAKRGQLETVHGTVQTPVFMNVGTVGAMKGAVATTDLLNLKTQIVLSNTYHLHVRPGDDVVKKMGGIRKFMVWDNPVLTDSGGFQVFSLAGLRKIKEEGVKIDEILYSPLVRAKETARHISEMTGIPYRVEPRLIEQNFGKWESTPRDGKDFKKAKEFFACSHEGGESTLRLAQRIYNLLDDIKKESEGKTYIRVAHNGIARVVQSYFTDMTNEEYAAWGVKNCAVVRYDF